MGRNHKNGQRRRKRSVAFANPEATTFGEGDSSNASRAILRTASSAGQTMGHTSVIDPFAGLNHLNTAPAPTQNSFNFPVLPSMPPQNVKSADPFAALIDLKSPPSPYPPASHHVKGQQSTSGGSLSQPGPSRAVGEISFTPSTAASPPSYIRPSILVRRPAPGDPFSGLIQVKAAEVPTPVYHFSNLIELNTLPSAPPPPPRKRRRTSLSNPPPVESFMSLSELRTAPSTPPPPSVPLHPLARSIPFLRARNPTEEPSESRGQPIVMPASPAQPHTSTVSKLPVPHNDPFANLLGLNGAPVAPMASPVPLPEPNGPTLAPIASPAPLPTATISAPHSDQCGSGELAEPCIALDISPGPMLRLSAPSSTSVVSEMTTGGVSPLLTGANDTTFAVTGNLPTTVESTTPVPALDPSTHVATNTTPTTHHGVRARDEESSSWDAEHAAQDIVAKVPQRGSMPNTPDTFARTAGNGDQLGDPPADASSSSDLGKPRHHCIPSFYLDCQIVDLMYGAQLVGAERVTALDREIESLKRVADATDNLKRIFHFRVANSWLAYNQVLLETADSRFEQ